jgi:SAM-dependent methyltransferase
MPRAVERAEASGRVAGRFVGSRPVRTSDYIDPRVESILDVGCNVGAWLRECRRLYPQARLAGIEPNPDALAIARTQVPDAELHHGGAEKLPFSDASFSVVTCVEVMEHVPAQHRATAFAEIRRVLSDRGRLILTVPHAGWFAFLDSNNVRLRLPGLYGALVGTGLRDPHYREIEWHHHFTVDELLALAGDGFRVESIRYGGLFVSPLMDWVAWPFYRLGKPDHWLRRASERAAEWDFRHEYGAASYRVLLVMDRVA